MNTQQQIEAFFLNHDDPYFEMIQNEPSEATAFDIAFTELRKISEHVDSNIVLDAVRHIREHSTHQGTFDTSGNIRHIREHSTHQGT